MSTAPIPTEGVTRMRLTHLFVSEIVGLQPLEIALPYYFRGHYLYDLQLDHVEPIINHTANRIMLRSPTSGAPDYDPNDPHLVLEESIRPIWAQEFERISHLVTQAARQNSANLSSLEVDDHSTPNHGTTTPTQSSSDTHSRFYAPRSGATHSAASAPVTRRTSPTPFYRNPNSGSSRALTPLREEDTTVRPSTALSGSTLQGDQPHNPNATWRHISSNGTSNNAPGNGNNPGGRLLQCPVHGGECPGEGTEGLADQVRAQLGLVEPVPAIAVAGEGNRMMIDWFKLLEEEIEC